MSFISGHRRQRQDQDSRHGYPPVSAASPSSPDTIDNVKTKIKTDTARVCGEPQSSDTIDNVKTKTGAHLCGEPLIFGSCLHRQDQDPRQTHVCLHFWTPLITLVHVASYTFIILFFSCIIQPTLYIIARKCNVKNEWIVKEGAMFQETH